MRKSYTTLYLAFLLTACGGGSGTDSKDVCVTDRLNQSECFTVTTPSTSTPQSSQQQESPGPAPVGSQATASAPSLPASPGAATAAVPPANVVTAIPSGTGGPPTPDPDGLMNFSRSQQCIKPEASNHTFCQMPFLRPQYKFVVGAIFVYGDNKYGIAIVPSDNAVACRVSAQPCSDYDAPDIPPTPPSAIQSVACQQKFSAPMETGRTMYCGAPEGAPTSSNASAFKGS